MSENNGWNVVDELCNYSGSLKDLIETLEKLKVQYGDNAKIEFDAGWSPVEVLIIRKK